MAEENCSAKLVVVMKFDMQCHESLMTAKDVKSLARKYNISLDRHHDSDVYDAFPDNDFSIQNVRTLTERIIDLRPVPLVVSMSEYLRFLFLSGAPIVQGSVVPSIFRGSSKVKKKEILAALRDVTASSNHVSSPTPLLMVAPVNQITLVDTGNTDEEPRAPNDENRLVSNSPCGSVSKFVNNFVNVEEIKDKESPSCIEPFVNLSGKPLHPENVQVFVSETNVDGLSHPLNCKDKNLSTGAHASRPREILMGRNIEEDESSRGASVYVPRWAIPQRCRANTPEWCREMMRAWFSLARGVMAQTDILERFENLLADYDTLADTHTECSKIVWKLVTARHDLKHNARFYTNAINRFKDLKEEHAGCGEKVKVLEDERNNLSVVNKDQSLRIQELEAEIARKDSALAAAEKMSAEGAKERHKLVAQLSQAEYEKLFKQKYPYVMKIASRYRHSVADLLKVHPDPTPSGGDSAPTISKALGGSSLPPN
nr:hypothetical protein [Tanacetum cinerariifolium]